MSQSTSPQQLGTASRASLAANSDFSRVPARPVNMVLNGPDPNLPANPPVPAPTPQQQPGRPAPSCPTDISVARVEQGNDVDFGKTGPITGWGGYAVMAVSDPSGRNWDGTTIHENLTRVKNTCGNQGNNICSNRSGEGGAGGSGFRVGAASNFLGLAPLAAARNRFYDLHVYATKGSSLLHQLNRNNCEVQCEQTYDCGGTRFGPVFVITYTMTRDSVAREGGGFNAVTRVRISKDVRATPPGGTTP